MSRQSLYSTKYNRKVFSILLASLTFILLIFVIAYCYSPKENTDIVEETISPTTSTFPTPSTIPSLNPTEKQTLLDQLEGLNSAGNVPNEVLEEIRGRLQP